MAYVRAYDFEAGSHIVPSSQRSDDASDAKSRPTTAYAKTGSYSWEVSGVFEVDGWIRFDPLDGEIHFGMTTWILLRGDAWTQSSDAKIRWVLGDGYVIDLRFNAGNKTWDLYVNNAKVADGSYNLPSQAWFNLRAWGTFADAGTFNLKVEGHTCINYAGDLVNTDATIAYVEFRALRNAQMYFDDLIFYDNAADPGDLRANSIRPSADTIVKDWDASAGADNYALVDETPASDADYVEAQVSAKADEYDLGDFDGVDKTIVGVSTWTRAWKTTAGAQQLSHGVDSGATNDVTTSDLTTNPEYYWHDMALNPADAAAWEDADIDALKHRIVYT